MFRSSVSSPAILEIQIIWRGRGRKPRLVPVAISVALSPPLLRLADALLENQAEAATQAASVGSVAILTAEKVAQRMLELLPPDGTPVLNRVMRVMISRDLEKSVSQDLYFEARDQLLAKGRVGRLRGQGGQLFLLSEKTERKPGLDDESPSWAEARLMQPLRGFLEGSFKTGLDLPKDGLCIVQDTSSYGPHRGLWARPDYILVSAMRFKLMPGAQVDVHSFELKTESGCTVQSVHEALAQTRFTHFGHLVWHLPNNSKAEARLAEIERHCEEHGVGLIRMWDPSAPDRCEILLDPRRKRTLSAAVEGFLESRLDADQRKRLMKSINGAAP